MEIHLNMVFEEQVDLNRERPLQGDVGASMLKRQQEEVDGYRKYRRNLSMIANIVKGCHF